MDCTEVNEFLSNFHDGELPSHQRIAIEGHLKGCPDCAQELDGFRTLSVLAEGLIHPNPPPDLWHQIEEQLSVERTTSRHPAFFNRTGWRGRPFIRFGLAVAAMILIVVGWIGYRTWLDDHGDHQFAAVFGQYLDRFRVDPHKAQETLLAKYQGRTVDPEQAVQTVGYRPAVADGLPEGYSIESTYVMKMPCCTCVQSICTRSDGTTIAIFEHDDQEVNEWFRGRREISAVCNGKSCSLVELGDRIGASWKRGKRHMTVIGLRDTREIGELAAWFDDRERVGLQ